jgi:hypothetical protein
MKREKKLLLLVAVFAVVVAGYAILSRFAPKEEKAGEESDVSIQVAAMDSSSVAQLTWTYSGETITLEHVKDGWSYPEDAHFPLDQTKAGEMVKAVSSVNATRVIDDAADLSEYGLDQPSCTVTSKLSDGGSIKLNVGNKNDVTGEYYLQVDGDQKVYLVDESIKSAFSYTLMDMVAKEAIPYFQTVTGITIGAADNAQKILYKDTGLGDGITYTDAYNWFYEVKTGNSTGYTPLSTAKVTELQDSLSGLSWKRCADYFATPEDLNAYGLREPKAEVTVDYSVYDQQTGTSFNTFALLIGDKTGDEYYAKIKDSDIVYIIDSSFVENLLAVNYEALRPDDVCLMDWSTVDSLDVTADGKSVTISFDRSGDSVAYKIGGAAADPTKVEAFLNGINGMEAAKKTDNASSSALSEVTLVFHRNTEYFKTMTFKLSKYDSAYYIVDFAGQTRLLVTKGTVTSLKEAFAAIGLQQ